jgi:hypothetical protein
VTDAREQLRKAYRRASIGLAIAAVVWAVAYFVARDRGWPEQTLVIPVGAAALSALCYWRYRGMN